MVIMATTDATRCYAVGDHLTPRPIRPAQPLPEQTNVRVNAAAEVFQSDLSRILSHHRHRNTGNRRNRQFIRRQLNGTQRRCDVATNRHSQTSIY